MIPVTQFISAFTGHPLLSVMLQLADK